MLGTGYKVNKAPVVLTLMQLSVQWEEQETHY